MYFGNYFISDILLIHYLAIQSLRLSEATEVNRGRQCKKILRVCVCVEVGHIPVRCSQCKQRQEGPLSMHRGTHYQRGTSLGIFYRPAAQILIL